MKLTNWTLGDFAKVNPSVSLNKGTVYPFVPMESVEPGTRFIEEMSSKEYTGNGVRFELGDSLFARITPCLENGKIAQFIEADNVGGFGSTEFYVFRGKKNVSDSDFLYYLLQTYEIRKYAENSLAGASGRQRADLKFIKNIDIQTPDIQSQKIIASILGNYDFLIKNNKKKIKILEEMAQLLYQEWFVAFRFPGYEKHKFVDSELGKISEGWEIATLREHLKLDKGVSYSGDGLTEEGNPMVNLKSISVDGRYVRGSDKPYSGDYKPRHVLMPGDIVLANTDMTQNGNVVGKAAIVPVLDTDKEIICSHHIYAVRIKKNTYLKRNYLLNLLNSYNFHGHAKGYAVGTTVLGLSAESIYRFSFALPEKEITDLFEEKTQEIYQLIENLENQNLVLQHTRDLLLPKLMSGEIDVSKLDINITEN